MCLVLTEKEGQPRGAITYEQRLGWWRIPRERQRGGERGKGYVEGEEDRKQNVIYLLYPSLNAYTAFSINTISISIYYIYRKPALAVR